MTAPKNLDDALGIAHLTQPPSRTGPYSDPELYTQADLDAAVNEALERAAVMVGTMQFPMQDSIDASVGLPPVGQRIAASIRAMKKETGK